MRQRLCWELGLFMGLFCYGGIYIAVGSINFWTQDRAELFPIAYNLITFGRHPMTIYLAVVRFRLTLVLPYGFLAFYPAASLVREEFRVVGPFTPVVGLLVFALGLAIWRFGAARYEGAGLLVTLKMRTSLFHPFEDALTSTVCHTSRVLNLLIKQ